MYIYTRSSVQNQVSDQDLVKVLKNDVPLRGTRVLVLSTTGYIESEVPSCLAVALLAPITKFYDVTNNEARPKVCGRQVQLLLTTHACLVCIAPYFLLDISQLEPGQELITENNFGSYGQFFRLGRGKLLSVDKSSIRRGKIHDVELFVHHGDLAVVS